MYNSSQTFNIGEIVEVLMGRDKGKLAIIIELLDDRFVLIADGDKRKFDQPKKKNVSHIRTTGYISREIIDSLKENSRVSNAKLRYILQDYISNYLGKDEEKGE